MADDEQNEPEVENVDLPDLGAVANTDAGNSNIEMIRDIEVTLSVELGRTQMIIDEVLHLTPGKVVELEKLAGEPLDILVNETVLAQGEVVAHRFGVRISLFLIHVHGYRLLLVVVRMRSFWLFGPDRCSSE